MGNSTSARADGADGQDPMERRLDGREVSGESGRSPRPSPGSRAPLLLASQVSISPLQGPDSSTPVFSQLWMNDSGGHSDVPAQKGIPMLITWNYGGNEVAVEGSWDNWKSRRALHRSGKDHSILLVLPFGVYYFKFIVDGEFRYIPDLPSIADDNGQMLNILDVNDTVPENTESVKEFESPPSPFNSYAYPFPEEEEFAKEPPTLPSQLHVSSLDAHNAGEDSPGKPQHVVLNHLFVEKGWAARSVVALGFTHRYQSKYVTVVLYKPLMK